MSKSRYRLDNNGNCWNSRTRLEKILIVPSVIILIIAIILATLVILHLQQNSSYPCSTCTSPTCLKEASEIMQRVDRTVNPCDDFYKFACGNVLKKAHGDENLGSFFVIQDKAQRQIQEMYSEPFRDHDHRMIRVAKQLYRACMNESAIAADGLKTIIKMLRTMGGWPIVEGSDWDGSKFWWIPASYKLREMGYFYASFMTVTLETDPEDENKFIFQVSMPDVGDLNQQTFDKQQLMVDVAVAFGANEERALIDVAEVYDFVLEMRRRSYSRMNDELPKRFVVSEFQRRNGFINWKEFINNIIGPMVRISSQDSVLFPSAQSLYDWYKFLQKTPKRIQANYMIWRAIERVIPFLPELHNQKALRIFLREVIGKHKPRPNFCIEQIGTRFSPSPIDILYVQKYLPSEKRNAIKEIIKNIKSELITLIDENNFVDDSEKYKAMEKLTKLTEVIGAPEDLFEDGMLDDLDFDMPESNSQTFLNLLAQVNRNHQSHLYSQIYSSKYEYKITKWNLQTSSFIGDYSREDNVINLPAAIFQDLIFNQLRPNHLNYGSMGTLMGHHLPYILGESEIIFDLDKNISGRPFEKSRECFSKQIEEWNMKNLHLTELVLHESLGLKVAYSAYNKLMHYQNTEELKLVGVNFTSKQLFWISAASYFCQPLNPHSNILKSFEDRDIFSSLVSIPMVNDQHFASDFNCPLGSKMNPSEKCEIF